VLSETKLLHYFLSYSLLPSSLPHLLLTAVDSRQVPIGHLPSASPGKLIFYHLSLLYLSSLHDNFKLDPPAGGWDSIISCHPSQFCSWLVLTASKFLSAICLLAAQGSWSDRYHWNLLLWWKFESPSPIAGGALILQVLHFHCGQISSGTLSSPFSGTLLESLDLQTWSVQIASILCKLPVPKSQYQVSEGTAPLELLQLTQPCNICWLELWPTSGNC